MAGVRNCEVEAKEATESIGSYNHKISFENITPFMCGT